MESIFTRLSDKDKPLFDNFFHTYNPNISEYTFTNLFVWRHSRLVEYVVTDDCLVIKVDYCGQKYFLPPIGRNIAVGYEFIKSCMAECGIHTVKLIDQTHIDIICKIFGPQHLSLTEDRDNFDYLYLTERLSSLSSRKLSNKRNFVHRFIANYKYDFVAYNDDYRAGCSELLRKWIAGRENDESLQNELVAIENLLSDYNILDVVGNVLLVAGQVVAFAFGEKLNDSTFVVHFEKADTSFVGAYQIVNQLFVQENVAGRLKFVNREQDLGHENIRKAKLSYHPDDFVKKHILRVEY